MPAPLPCVNWQQIRSAVEAGLPLNEAAQRFHVPLTAIRKRSSREGWVTASKVGKLQRAATALGQQARQGVTHVTQPDVTAAAAVAASIGQRGEALRLSLLMLAQAGADKSIRRNLPVDSWADAKTVADIAAKAAAWDRAEPSQVAVQVLFDSSSFAEALHVSQGPVIDLDAPEACESEYD